MLKTIICDDFRTPRINFHEGLNVVLGDAFASNSIGKSTLLMIIDFCLGGTDFLKHNQDAIAELGHHAYKFCHEFEQRGYWFERSTESPDIVLFANAPDSPHVAMKRSEFGQFLKEHYGIRDASLSFRRSVSFAIRVWGRDNLNVKKPLHTVQEESGKTCLVTLLSLFNEQEAIHAIQKRLSTLQDTKKFLNKGAKLGVLPKTSKTIYRKNADEIEVIESEIEQIRNHLKIYATNINDFVKDDILELRDERAGLEDQRIELLSRIGRIERSIAGGKHFRNKSMERLIEFFPDVNIGRLEEIEGFHSGIATILRKQMRDAESALKAELQQVENSILRVSQLIEDLAPKIDQPGAVVDEIYSLSSRLSSLKRENRQHDQRVKVAASIEESEKQYSAISVQRLARVSDTLNAEISRIVDLVYEEQRRSPVFTVSGKNYQFQTFEDSGTGKAYSDLIVFDLALLSTSDLPLLVHDSILFKNVQNKAISQMVSVYASAQKQTFIAIDEIQKYGDICSSLLEKHAVIQLSNESTLFKKDWR